MTADVTQWPWRVGRKVGRTIYALVPGPPDGLLIGLMDTADIAAAAVRDHNDALGQQGDGR